MSHRIFSICQSEMRAGTGHSFCESVLGDSAFCDAVAEKCGIEVDNVEEKRKFVREKVIFLIADNY